MAADLVLLALVLTQAAPSTVLTPILVLAVLKHTARRALRHELSDKSVLTATCHAPHAQAQRESGEHDRMLQRSIRTAGKLACGQALAASHQALAARRQHPLHAQSSARARERHLGSSLGGRQGGSGREGRSKTSQNWEPPHSRQRALRLLWGQSETFCALSSGRQMRHCRRSRLCSQNCDPPHVLHVPVCVHAHQS